MKKILKILALSVAIWQAVGNPVNISLVYSQVATPTDTPIDTPTPTPTTDPGLPTPTPSDDIATPTPTATPLATDTPTPTDTPIPDLPATDSAVLDSTLLSPTPTPTPVDPVIDQTATATVDTSAAADTGTNAQESSSSTDMITGDAGATADSITVVNLSAVDSNLIAVVQTVLTSNTGDIDLYQALISAIANNPNIVPANTDITVNQTATVDTDTTSSANTGTNTQTAGTTAMTTGDAVSLANAINAVNLNLVGSNAVLAIINILADWNGNIILPNGTQFSLASLLGGGVNLDTNQSAAVTSNTSSTAITGDNTQNAGITNMTTGDAVSMANSGTITNVIEIGNGIGFLVINNLGEWTGDLINWSAPGSIQSLPAGSYDLIANYGDSESIAGGNINITSNQTAMVNTNVSSNATTGSNSQAARLAYLLTGNAFSLANNFTLANFTGIGGGIFFGIINIFGKWTGNVITAYPELNVSLTDNQNSVNPGGEENYFITITNAGHAIAHGVNLIFSFPIEVAPDGGQNTSWSLGDLAPGQTQTFDIAGHVSGSAPAGTNLLASATGSTNDTQDATDGNTGTDTTNVIAAADSAPDTRTPNLHVDTWTNTGAFVYPGDTVLASITVFNTDSFIAKNVEVVGSVQGPDQNTIIPLDWKLGDLKANGKAKISFNITIKNDAPGGLYHLYAKASGQSESGDGSSSNLADSVFKVYAGDNTAGNFVPPVFGSGGELSGGDTLGLNTQSIFSNTLNRVLPYILPFLAAAYLLIVVFRRRLNGEPIVSPAFAGFVRKKGSALAGGVSILIVFIALEIFIRKRL